MKEGDWRRPEQKRFAMNIELQADPDRIMRPAEIAEFCGASTRTVQRWLSDGTLKKVRLGLRITGARRGDVVELTMRGAR
jgi:excisionase family DNA binding protein